MLPRIVITTSLALSLATAVFAQDTTINTMAPVGVAAPVAKKPLAIRPPLGWNSYDSYRNHIGEEETLGNLEAFAKKLAPHGYEYFVVDLGWYTENALIPGTNRPAGGDRDFSLDGHGYPIGSRTWFPNGMKRIADRAHQLGVKFGLHLMRGMLRKAHEFNLPVAGTPYRMRDIADTRNLCPWCPFTYGVDMTKPGAQAYYDGLIRHMAEMGVDFIKYDDLVPHPAELEAIGKAVAACGRDIVLSLSPGDDTTPAHKAHYQWGHMLRITGDVWDNRTSLNKGFQRWRDWQGSAGPGFWPDLDMLCLGTLSGMIGADGRNRDKAMAEDLRRGGDLEGLFFRPGQLTPAQERTFMTMRALCASPLFMGGCLIRSEQRVFDLITHPDLLACNQNGVCGTLQREQTTMEVWRTPKNDHTDKGWIGVFNRSATDPLNFTPALKDLGLPEGRFRFRSIWGGEIVESGKSVTIAADDVLFLTYEHIKN